MIYSAEVQNMCSVAKGAYHGPAPIPEEGKWVQAKEIKDISGFTHGIGWCAPQQGACKLTLNVKNGVIEEASFTGHGCAISQASADIMADLITGETVEEAKRLSGLFLAMIRGEELSEDDFEDLDEAAQLKDISHMPARVKCAELAWRTLDGILS